MALDAAWPAPIAPSRVKCGAGPTNDSSATMWVRGDDAAGRSDIGHYDDLWSPPLGSSSRAHGMSIRQPDWRNLGGIPGRRFVACSMAPNAELLHSASTPDVPICAAVQDGAGRRSGALFGARVGALDRRLGCGRRCPQHMRPNAVPCTAQPRQATSLLAPVTAPGTISSRHDGGSNYQ